MLASNLRLPVKTHRSSASELWRSYKLFWLLPPLLLAGCSKGTQPVLKKVEFNNVMRRDMGPLSDQQRNGQLSPFYDAENSGEQRLTELYPVPAGFNSASALADLLKKLRRSDFYYAPGGESLRVAWEVVGEFVSELDGCAIFTVGGCSSAVLTDPTTRDPVSCDGTVIVAPNWHTAVNATFALQRCSGPNQDPFGPLTTFSQGCALAATSCAELTQNHPFCQIDCDLRAATGTHRLTINVSDGSTNVTATRELKPTVVVPQMSATINRLMQKPTPGPGDPTPPPTPPAMTWSAATNPDNTWVENYSPSFSISRVRVLARKLSGETQQVEVGELNLYSELRNVIGGRLRLHTCNRDAGLQEFSPRTCLFLSEATPTYQRIDPEKRLIWQIEVPESRADGSRNFQETDDIFIEFTLAAPVASSGGLTAAPFLTAEPDSLSVEDLPPNVESRFENRVLLINSSDRPLTLRRFRISSFTHGQVAVELPARRALPFTIFPGTLVPLTLRVTPDPTRGVFRSLFFTYDDGNVNSPREGMFSVGGRTYISRLSVAPAALDFEPGAQQYFLVMNSGPAPLTVTTAEFRGVSRRSFTFVNPSQFPMTVNAGTHQRVYIQYQPQMIAALASGNGLQNATLELTSNGGDKSVTLTGGTGGGVKPPSTLRTTIAVTPRSRWW